MDGEQWRYIPGYIGYYQASNLGRIRSVDRVIPHRLHGTLKLKGMIRKTRPDGQYGYLIVTLSKEGVRKCFKVHRLIAITWIGLYPEGEQVRHGPNGKLDNSVANLSYGTKHQDGLDHRRDGTHRGRAVRRSDREVFINMHVAAEKSGCYHQNIWKVCNGKRKTAGGYGWSYVEEFTKEST